jgi:RsiW-degrading membrane proteinase PrsW (M82 family)
MEILETILFAILGGILPAFFWLFFWLREDNHPEPKILIWKAFLYGMLAVPFALSAQYAINLIFINTNSIQITFQQNIFLGIFVVMLWALAEEFFKYKAAYNSGIKNRANDEPVDAMIYMITAALGFSALENTLFLFNVISDGQATVALITGSFRFIGATLLHVASSAIIGYFISISFYKNKTIKKHAVIWGFIIATGLHAFFNSIIIISEKFFAGKFTIISFGIVWITIIAIILLFEKVKNIYIRKNINK